MNHGYVIENNIVDLYLMGNLSEEESEQFELHFVDCQRCLDLLEMCRSFKYGLRVIEDDPIWEEPARGAGPFGWLAQLNTERQVAILAFAIILLLTPITLLIMRAARLQDELNRVKSSIAKGEENSGDIAKPDMGNVNGNRQAGLAKGDQATAEGEKQKGDRREALAPTRPQINTPIFLLSSVRSVPANSPGSVNDFIFPEGSKSFILSIDLEGEPEYKTYHVVIRTGNNRTLWQANDLEPDEHNSLVITFPGDFLKEGSYTLSLNGVDQSSKLLSLSEYRFRVIKRKSPQ